MKHGPLNIMALKFVTGLAVKVKMEREPCLGQDLKEDSRF